MTPIFASTDFTITSTDAHSIIALRRTILRPEDGDTSWCDYAGDRELSSLHLRVLLGPRAVGMVSCIAEPSRNASFRGTWRIRGLGVVKDMRGFGIGSNLLQSLLAEIDVRDRGSAWLSGRLVRQAFYERNGFRVASNPYEVKGTGLHCDFSRG